MQYNTQQKRMPLPEYGRSIQNMVDYALTIQDRAERQRCANTIINIMGNMFPHLRDIGKMAADAKTIFENTHIVRDLEEVEI